MSWQRLLLKNFVLSLRNDKKNVSFRLSFRSNHNLNNYLELIELYLQPDLILLGGGASKYFEAFKTKITIETPVEPAVLQNTAGIVGAAMYANLF